MSRLDRLAILCITLPGIIAIARLALAVAHPSFLTVLAKHFVEQLAR